MKEEHFGHSPNTRTRALNVVHFFSHSGRQLPKENQFLWIQPWISRKTYKTYLKFNGELDITSVVWKNCLNYKSSKGTIDRRKALCFLTFSLFYLQSLAGRGPSKGIPPCCGKLPEVKVICGRKALRFLIFFCCCIFQVYGRKTACSKSLSLSFLVCSYVSQCVDFCYLVSFSYWIIWITLSYPLFCSFATSWSLQSLLVRYFILSL